MNGVFAPFAYLPPSGAYALFPASRPITLMNRWSGIPVVVLALLGFALLLKNRNRGAVVAGGLSALIVLVEVFWVTVVGVTGRQYSSIADPMLYFPQGPKIVYDLTVRAPLGSALGYLVGGYQPVEKGSKKLPS